MSKVFASFNLYLNLELTGASPSNSTTMLWIKKIGYTQLVLPKVKADDWIIIVDESIGIGQEKVLVILGIRQSQIDFTRPLRLQDMEPITVKSKEHWTTKDVASELRIVQQKLGTVKYAVTDGGSALRCGLNEVSIKQVYDITHAIAIYLQRIYEGDECFKNYTHLAGQMRYKLCCSKVAHLIPPNQRTKSRFLNIDTISKWGLNTVNALKNKPLCAEERLNLQWVIEKKPLIIEMDKIMAVVKKISILLKNKGLTMQTKSKCISLLSKFQHGKLKQFREYMLNYLTENSKHIQHRKEKVLCCSDIIESSFGRYKNELSKNPMSGITDLVLIIPALTVKLSTEVVNAAIDNCTVKNIELWKQNNLCNSLLAKRKKVFQN